MAPSSRVRGVVLTMSILVATPAAAQSTDTPPPPPAKPDAPPPPPAKPDAPPAPPPRPMHQQPHAGQSTPTPRRGPARPPRRGPRNAVPVRGVPIVSAPTFHRLPDDSTRISVEVDAAVDVGENHPQGRLVYRFKGAFVPERVNRMPLVTGWFPTPVERAYLVQQGPDVDLVIELHEATTPAMKITPTPRGIVLQVDFPKTRPIENNGEPSGDASRDRARRLRTGRTLGAGDSDAPPAPRSGNLVDPPPPPPGGSPDKPPPDEPARPVSRGPTPRERIIGFGTAIGGGVQTLTSVSSTGSTSTTNLGDVTGALMLPSLEVQVFLPREYSIDLSVPLTTMILVSAIAKGYYLSADLMFNINAGSGATRFLLGPGIGFTAAKFSAGTLSTPTMALVRVPGQIGVEWLNKKRNFGFKLMARPWLDIAPSATTNAVGGGVLGLIEFSGFVTRGSSRGSVSED